ncbi:MAG TPA: PrsW family intramembrane metalloprotease [Anaerolineales bacterium]|nr:PrsW family intramembrane metalloprotease [Anaerolineales bacterium]
MPFLVALFFAFVPALFMAAFIYSLDRYEKEPLILLGAAFCWGAIIAAGAAFLINTVFGVAIYAFTGSDTMADQATASLVAPFVEEGLKGLAVLLVFLFFRSEFDSVLDGIIYAGVTALGFAATENVLYIYEHGYVPSGWNGLWELVFVRDVMVAWQHPFFTAFIGISLAVARMNRQMLIKVIAIPIGYASAVFAHALHNSFGTLIGGLTGFAIGSLVDWSGWIAMGLFIVFMIVRERSLLQDQLRDEVATGTITSAQYRRALSPFTMSTSLLTGGRTAARFYQVCGELAHKKNQLRRLGDERGNTAIVQSLRTELASLAPRVRA